MTKLLNNRPQKSSSRPSPFKDWQSERAILLHRACQSIKAAVQRGGQISKAISKTAARLDGKAFQSDPSRKLRLKASTLFQKFRTWRLCGQSKDAFKLNYFPTSRRIPASVLIRFVNFAAASEFQSCKAAWRAFCQRRGNAGPGKVQLGYDALMWNLPRGFWRKVKAAHQTKRQAEQTINMTRLAAIVEIQRRVPDKLPRRKPADFQI